MFSTARGGGGCQINAFDASGHHRVAYGTGSGGLNSTTTDWSVGAFDIMLLIRASGVFTLWQNGVATDATGSTAMTSAGTAVALGFPAAAAGGDITGDAARAGIYDHALGASERFNFFHALGAKYGITVV